MQFCTPISASRCKKSSKQSFWQLIPKTGFESILFAKESLSSLGELNAIVDYTRISEDLFALVKSNKDNLVLQQFLLDEYFPESKNNFSNSSIGQQKLFDVIAGKILNESPEEYRREIKKLLVESNEEEIFIRGSLFKR